MDRLNDWAFAARAALAGSYVTLGFADPSTAADLAIPYGIAVLVVATCDLLKWRWRVAKKRRLESADEH